MTCELKSPYDLMLFLGRTFMWGMSLKLTFRKPMRTHAVQNLSSL